MSSWEKYIRQHVNDAKKVLAEYGLPTVYEDLVSLNYQPEDWRISSAIRVITGYKKLLDEVKNNKIDKALERLFWICAASEELWLYTIIGDVSEKKTYAPFRKRPILESDINDMLIKQVTRMANLSENGGKNKIPQSKLDEWQKIADSFFLKSKSKSISSAAKHIAEKTGDSYHTISKKIKFP